METGSARTYIPASSAKHVLAQQRKIPVSAWFLCQIPSCRAAASAAQPRAFLCSRLILKNLQLRFSKIKKLWNVKNTPERIPRKKNDCFIFFHPDCTVGFGVAPNHALRLVGFTTGRDLHPALKIYSIDNKYNQQRRFCQAFCNALRQP